MDPHVYPDPQLAPLTLPAAPGMGAPAPTFIAIEQLAAPDPATPFIAKTMFIRVAMSGAPCASVISPTAPNFYLKADTGDVVLINDHTKLPDQTYSIYHRPGSDPRDFVADGKVDLENDNVFRITVVFQDPAGNYAWQLGIWNNDTGASRDFTWVVSATLANTAQPWIDVEPTLLSWDVLVNNKGTAPFTVNSVSPAFPAGFALGLLPVSLNPGASAPLTVTFTGSGNSAGSNGDVTATANLTITPADGTAGTSAGHNSQLSVSATDDLTVRSLTLKRDGVDPSLWPALSCSQANEASLMDSSLRLDPNREILFQGGGSMRSSGDMRFLTGTPAATERARILANGNVGIGTSAPDRHLTVQGNAGGTYLNVKDTATAGGGPWEVLMGVDANGGILSTVTNHDLQLRSGVNNTHMVIKNDGKVGIGTPNPSSKLEVTGDWNGQEGALRLAGDKPTIKFAGGSIAANRSWLLHLGSNGPGNLEFFKQGATPSSWDTVIALTPSGNVGIGTSYPAYVLDVAGRIHGSGFPTSSDERFKTNIVPLSNALGKIDGISGVVFDWNELYESLGRSTGRREIGVIAQDVEKVFPELVSTWGEEHYKAVDYGRLTGVLVEAIKELKAKNKDLERRLELLENPLGTARNTGMRDESPEGSRPGLGGNVE